VRAAWVRRTLRKLAYTEESDVYLELGDEIKAGHGLFKVECDLVDKTLPGRTRK